MERSICHYSSSHSMLLVGEGDFSFSACLARAFGSAKNMVATSCDTQGVLLIKHWSAEGHLEELEARGCRVLHGVDVNDMHQHRDLKMMRFDRIIFNFPHAGHDPFFGERDMELIRRHKELMMAFFENARELLKVGGEVHVSHRNDYPYNRWKLEKLAKKAGMVMVEMVEFRKGDYPGYNNKRGGWINSNKTFPLRECFTFKFCLMEQYSWEVGNGGSKGCGDELVRMLGDMHF